MKPSQVANYLRKIATAIETSRKPDKSLVAQDIKRILAVLTAGIGPWTWFHEQGLTPDATLYDILNLGDGVLEDLVKRSVPVANLKDPVNVSVSGDPDAGNVTITTSRGTITIPFTADMSGRDFVNRIQRLKVSI